ncbi:Putative type III restriction-modification methylase [Candidatus Fokinia solitaria]|uniref:site-specific DNA-methyltransferase (adenine-specific) n=1 Tax=Candidatus Fokinia solitaria TaxID=1802984 RepID=A0A2U8BSE0_9RICK|nr:site-specific DNA-methyltransferase [Candidatus Fokinia solitaria]AWD33225.1 Putative type III restriction-modification methylase [Candidatus Fokinia solitaria]
MLNFPFKDCILEGGQSKDEADYGIGFNKDGVLEEKPSKRKEVFFNEVIAKDDIDVLLNPKAIMNMKSYGEREGEIDHEKDNLLMKGNNLLALYSLLPIYRGKIKLIYIDPPYNTGNDSFQYNDNFNHSTWLTFMKNRLEVAKELLRDDGSIYITLDYNEVHYAKILTDEIFGRENFQREIIWNLGSVSGYKSTVKGYVRQHETILFYSKNNSKYFFNKKLAYTEYTENYIQNSFKEDGNGKYRFRNGEKVYLSELKGLPIGDVWDVYSLQTRTQAKELVQDFKGQGQKPEELIERVIQISTEEGDIVLDFFGGSGTTGAVAHKMKRRWIMIEQMDYVETITKVRMEKVIEGEQGGISKNQKWEGGGSFCYFELAKWNEKAKEQLLSCNSLEELKKLFHKLYEKYFFKYNFNAKRFFEGQNGDAIVEREEFKELSLSKQKEIFCKMLDLNQMYILANEVEDKVYELSEEDIILTKNFYNR